MDPQSINIPPGDKQTAAKSHLEWLRHSACDTRLYTDGSRNATNSAGCHITTINDDTPTTLHEGSYNLGLQTNILDAEIHTIRERIRWIFSQPTPRSVQIWVDNQKALKDLGGGHCRLKKDLKICLKGIRTLLLAGCSVNRQYTWSHEGIPGTKHADRLANKVQKKPPCTWTKTTLAWLRIHSKEPMIKESEGRTHNHETPISTPPDLILRLIPR